MKHTNETTNNPPTSLPWYRYAIVWLVIMLPAIAVAAGITTMFIAHQNAPQSSIAQQEAGK